MNDYYERMAQGIIGMNGAAYVHKPVVGCEGCSLTDDAALVQSYCAQNIRRGCDGDNHTPDSPRTWATIENAERWRAIAGDDE